MVGESDLAMLLKNMNPVLREEEYVFLTSKDNSLEGRGLSPIMTFNEQEGKTWIVTKQDADDHNLMYSSVWRLITLAIHSNLEAIGFISTITTALAKARISTNVASAFYHDHIFVPDSRAQDAIMILTSLSEEP